MSPRQPRQNPIRLSDHEKILLTIYRTLDAKGERMVDTAVSAAWTGDTNPDPEQVRQGNDLFEKALRALHAETIANGVQIIAYFANLAKKDRKSKVDPERHQEVTSNLLPARHLENIDLPEDAAATAAYKLNVILDLVEAGESRSNIPPNSDNSNDDGGYGLLAAAGMIRELRDYLRASVAHATAERQKVEGAR